MCLYPKIINNRKYVVTKKNKGIIPIVKDLRTLQIPVGCGKCMECRKQKAREWQVRLQEEIRHDKTGKYVTMSFSDKSIIKIEKTIKGLTGYNLDNEIATRATRLFLERWRKEHKKSVKHWLVTELGQIKTERIHIHGIIWTSKDTKEIDTKWGYGNIYHGYCVNERTINYIIKYISKTDIKHKEYKSKILTSPGIGKEYLKRWDSKQNKYNENKTKETYITRAGTKIGLPIYYRNKIYTEDEREKLWIKKLDEEIRWINGIKIDISKNEDRYYKILEQEREKNTRLKYGNDEKNWERIKYENQRRKLKIKERYIKTLKEEKKIRLQRESK